MLLHGEREGCGTMLEMSLGILLATSKMKPITATHQANDQSLHYVKFPQEWSGFRRGLEAIAADDRTVDGLLFSNK